MNSIFSSLVCWPACTPAFRFAAAVAFTFTVSQAAFSQDAQIQTFEIAGSLGDPSFVALTIDPFDTQNGTLDIESIGLEFDGFIDMEIEIKNYNSFDLDPTDWFYDAGANMILAFDQTPGFEDGGPFYGLGGVFESFITGTLSAGSGGDPFPFGNATPGEVTVTADLSNDFVGAVESTTSLNYFRSDEPLTAKISPFLDLISSPAEDSDGFIDGTTTMLDFSGTLTLTYNAIATLGRAEDCNGDGSVDINDLDCICSASPDALDNILSEAGLFKGDLDGDGTVAFADFLKLSANFGQAGNYLEGDLDCSGEVGFADFLMLSNNFGLTNEESQAVPEPTAATHVAWLFAIAGLMRCRRSERAELSETI